MICLSRHIVVLGTILSAILLAACAPAQAPVANDVPSGGPAGKPDSLVYSEDGQESFAQVALREKVHDSLAVRPSWTYYQYALEAMDNQEWLLARHYLDESLRQFIAEKHDTLYHNVPESVDSIYRAQMPLRIVDALDEVYPNISEIGVDAGVFEQNEVSIEGVDALDESAADSAALQVIENFLDTIDVAQFTLPVVFNERVMQEIFYMSGGARSFTEGSLNRKTAYDSLVYSKLDEMGMPRDLIYLALVESGFKLKAYSRAKASGMWQFIPETGKRYGLQVDYWVDMRRNPEMATTAALKYLSRLYNEFNDWLLAMAAYNCGEGRVRRLVKEKMADSTWDTTQVVTYWDLELPKETMRYVPRILAAMVIGHYPEQYDMKINRQYRPDFDTVTVFDSFPLEEVAKVLKVPEDTLRSLNMELVKWCTPPNRDSYLLRLPVGTRSAFVDGYDKMEKNNFSSWHHHKVKRGESLGVISRQYGISVKELQQANDMKGTRIRAGQTLLIPIKVTPKKSTGKKPAKVKTYVAKLGDNVATVARLFGVSQESIRVWNSMKEDHVVNPGDTLFVSKPELKPVVPQASSAPKLAKGERYVVGEGDTYAEIAKKFGVPVVMLLEANGGYSHRLSVGDSLVIPEFTQTVVKNAPKSSEKQAKADKSSSEKPSAKPAKTADKQAGSATAKSEKPAKERVHVVKKGEGLWDISRQYGVTIEDIVRWNDLKDTKIRIGDKLIIRK